MKNIILLILLFSLFMAPVSDGQTISQYIQYYLDISSRASEYLDDLFQEFSDGYIEADEALGKLSILKNEYMKSVEPVPEEAAEIHRLMKQLISMIENYFIYFKRTNRESPIINLKIMEARYELAQEAQRLASEY